MRIYAVHIVPGQATELEHGTLVAPGDIYQVVLFNDDHNTMEHVVGSLIRVFGHRLPIATRIMMEAHRRGRAIAEVEDEERARLHRDQLQSLGLTATIEKIVGG